MAEQQSGLGVPGQGPQGLLAPALRLSLPNRLDSLEFARLALHDYLAPLALSAKVWFKLELVLEETLMNISLHAFSDADPHQIGLQVGYDGQALYLRFEDDGLPFDPSLAAAPVLPTSIAEASPGGLGLMLVRKQARAVDYARVDGRNQLTITLDYR